MMYFLIAIHLLNLWIISDRISRITRLLEEMGKDGRNAQ
jgi:hypothetical protein